MKSLKNLLSFITNLIFPHTCMSCGAFTSYKYYTGICLECYKDIRPFNIKQQPSLYKIIEDAYFDDFNARFIYDDKVAKTILDFKFNDKTQNYQL